jgi:hypothetical protein
MQTLSQALQKADWDIVKPCIDAKTCKKVIREQREDNTFRNFWTEIEALLDYVDVVIEKHINDQIVERGKIDAHNTHIHDLSLSWVDAGTSIKSVP